MFLLDLLKSIGGPGSLGFLLLSIAAAAALAAAGPRARRWARRWLAVVASAYLFLSLPVVASALARYAPPAWSAQHPTRLGAERIIVIDGDNPRGRAREAAAWYRASPPPQVLVSGGRFMAHLLVEAGIARGRFHLDDTAPTTRTQVIWMHDLAHGPRTVVITSRLQAPRLAALMARAGIDDMTLVPAPVDREPATTGTWRFVPSWSALMVSRDACYERLALLYYRWRGWI
ncbi:MAG TPA: YdcF family protein [Vicinamibacterales bacterium]|nr:YdcF family protein [Vicinamibacterales bacterium]